MDLQQVGTMLVIVFFSAAVLLSVLGSDLQVTENIDNVSSTTLENDSLSCDSL